MSDERIDPQEREAMEVAMLPENRDIAMRSPRLGFEAGWLAAREYSKQREEELEREQASLLDHTHDAIWERFERRVENLRKALQAARPILLMGTHERIANSVAGDLIARIDAALAENGDEKRGEG
jgi:hypothetical protein